MGVTQLGESLNSSLHEVVRVGATLCLCQHVGNTYRLQHGTHSTTGLHSRTVSSGLNIYAGTTKLSILLVRYSSLQYRNLNQVLLCSLSCLSNSCRYFTCLTQALAYDAVLITNNNDSCKGESTSTLRNFCYAVDCHQTLLELQILSSFYTIHISIVPLEFETCLASSICK